MHHQSYSTGLRQCFDFKKKTSRMRRLDLIETTFHTKFNKNHTKNVCAARAMDCTPLVLACLQGKEEEVAVLLASGADPTVEGDVPPLSKQGAKVCLIRLVFTLQGLKQPTPARPWLDSLVTHLTAFGPLTNCNHAHISATKRCANHTCTFPPESKKYILRHTYCFPITIHFLARSA